MKLVDLTGQRFGRLVVIRRASLNIRGKPAWDCRCDCGAHRTIPGAALRKRNTRSCGCLKRDASTNRMRMHGDACHGHTTAEFRAWCSARERCSNPKNPAFKNYGGRGIVVCERWLTSYDTFLADMGRKPSPAHTLDRVDNNGPYSPENCRWATRVVQANNTRRNRLLEEDGHVHTAKDWSHLTGLSLSCIWTRLSNGWSIHDTLTLPWGESPRRANR